MKRIKGLFVSLLLVSLFSSFAVKPKATNAMFCGPWVTVCNGGSVTVDYVNLLRPNVEREIFTLTSSNCDYSGPALWGGSGYPVIEVKVDLASGQNGSIQIYEGSTLVACEPTTTSRTYYNIDIPITGCLQYTVLITTGSC